MDLNNSTSILGGQLVINGNFATNPAATWTAGGGWTWGSGRMSRTGTTGPINTLGLDYGGSGYTSLNILTLVGGNNDANIKITGLIGSSIAPNGWTILNAGTGYSTGINYSVTGGTGTGAKFSITRLVDTNSLDQNTVAVVVGKQYLVGFTWRTYSKGSLYFKLGDVNSIRFENFSAIAAVNFISTPKTTDYLRIYPSTDFTGSIDDVSIKEIISMQPVIQIKYNNNNIGLDVWSGGKDLNNTLIGLNSGKMISTTASRNVIVGANGFQQNYSGFRNVGVGYSILSNNVTGSENTAVGYATLTNNIMGSSNSILGAHCLTSNTIGSGNVCIGNSGLYNNTTGSYNASIANALNSNTTGSSNTAIGVSSLNLNLSGNNNIGISESTLYNNTTGSYNTAIGASAGYLNTLGNNNLFIGNYADLNSITKQWSNVTVIGNYAKADANRVIILGALKGSGYDSNVGIGTATPVNTLNIIGDFNIVKIPNSLPSLYVTNNGTVGIGTVAPQKTLDVNGSLALQNDNDKLYLGSANDSSITYDGTDTIFNNEIGTGQFKFNGDLNMFSSGNQTIIKSDGNILMKSPNGTLFNCGVTDGGVFTCN